MIFGIYTFGNFEIGMGHIYRTIRFANYILENIEGSSIVFEVLDTEEARNIFSTLGILLPVNFHKHGIQPKGHWDILLVDRLTVSLSAMQALKKQTNLLVSIDDSGAGRFAADIAINCLYLPKFVDSSSPTESYIGFEYLMLDPNFHRTRIMLPPVRSSVGRLLVAQGGTDTHGLVPKLMNRIGKALKSHRIEVHALVPAHALTTPSYEKLRTSLPEVFLHSNVENMPKFLGTFDLAITGIGMMAFELAALGIPLIMLTGEQKEMETGRMLELKAGAYLCPLAEIEFQTAAIDSACSAALNLINNMKERIRLSNTLSSLIDGLGYQRMADLIVRKHNNLSGRGNT